MSTHPEFKSPFRVTTIELDPDIVARFRTEAAKRETTVPHLVRELLEVIAVDKLTSAILDDGVAAPVELPGA